MPNFLDQAGNDFLDQAGNYLRDQAGVSATEDLTETAGLADTVTAAWGASVAETVGFTDALTAQVSLVLLETLGLADTVDPGPFVVAITEMLGLTDTVAVNYQQSIVLAFQLGLDARLVVSSVAYSAITETLGLADTVATEQALVLALVEMLGLQDTVTPTAQIVASVVFGLGLADTWRAAYGASISEQLGLADALATNVKYWQSIAEGLGLSATFTNAAACYVALEEGVGLSDTVAPNMRLTAAIEEGLGLRFTLLLENEFYYGHIANAEGAFPESDIRGWTFNSFFAVDGHYYGVNATGIYELIGDDDAGTDIDLDLMFGLIDPGNGLLSRMEDAQLGITTDGTLYLGVRTTVGGSQQEHWYELETVTANAPREVIQPIGKGLKGLYWQFRLQNVDGASLQLDQLRVYPIILSRRRSS